MSRYGGKAEMNEEKGEQNWLAYILTVLCEPTLQSKR